MRYSKNVALKAVDEGCESSEKIVIAMDSRMPNSEKAMLGITLLSKKTEATITKINAGFPSYPKQRIKKKNCVLNTK